MYSLLIHAILILTKAKIIYIKLRTPLLYLTTITCSCTKTEKTWILFFHLKVNVVCTNWFP